jgi:hypothetical protein
MSKNTPQKRGAKEAGVAAPSSTPQQNPAPRIVQENATAAAAAAAAASSSHPAIMMDVESDPASVISDGHSGTGRGRGDSAQIAADLAAAKMERPEKYNK